MKHSQPCNTSPLVDSQEARTVWWLTLVLFTLATVIVIMGFVIPLIAHPSLLQSAFVLTNLTSLAVIACALLMVYFGYVRFAATIAVFFLFIAVTYANIRIFGNARSPNLLAYFVLIPLAGLILGKHAMLRFSVLCIAAVVGIFYLELADILPAQPPLQSRWDELLVWFLALAFNTILLMATIRRAEENANTAQYALAALQESQTQLQQALEKEKELSELKSRFVSMASHEFRTPLTTIFTLSETLRTYRNKLTEPQIDERLDKMQEQLGYLTAIMEDVLQLARLQARRMEFNPVWLNLDALCRTILEEFQSHPQAVQRLQYLSTGAHSKVYVDKRLMRQIFSNLISNALKYSPKEKMVHVQLREQNTDVILEICDKGIGIPPTDLQHLFEPFHRGENVGVVAGTGLGLVIVKEAVELHGGTITVKSLIGTGTTVTVQLPVRTDTINAYEKSSDH